MKWFKHDSTAHMDARIKKLKHKYGIVGYGLYWYCIELIAFGVEKNNISFELEEDAETIALEWSIDQLKVQEIMMYIVELGLFEQDNGMITCMKLARRLDDTNSKNPEMRQVLAKLNGIKSEKLRATPNISAQTILDKTRLDETKVNNTKDLLPAVSEPKKVKRFIPPTFEQVIEYCNQRKNTVDANKFLDHYDSAGWMRGKTKIKCWKACVRTWENNSSNQTQAKFSKPAKPGMYEQTMGIDTF